MAATHPGLHPLLLGNVVCTGGLAACPGFRARLAADLRALVPDDIEACPLCSQGATWPFQGLRGCSKVQEFRGRVSRGALAEGVQRPERPCPAARCEAAQPLRMGRRRPHQYSADMREGHSFSASLVRLGHAGHSRPSTHHKP